MKGALEEKLQGLPEKPGVYLFKDAKGKVIYVGKAIRLKDRVRSYFQSSRGHSAKTLAQVRATADLELLVTKSEIEALILEGNLIKKYKPRYNILLKDDKAFPYLKLTVDEPYPRMMVSRKPHLDKARYFGPYVHAGAMWRTLRLIHRHLGLRQCDIEIDRKRPRPCLYYDLHQCDAPCVSWGETREQYAEHVRQAQMLLEGREDSLKREILARMQKASAEEKFEDAARLRDSLKAIEEVQRRQHVVLKEPKDVDVIAFAREEGESVMQVFFVRSGKLIDRQTLRLKHNEGADEGEMLGAFIPQFYAGGAFVPEELVLSREFEDWEAVRAWLEQKRGAKVLFSFPQRGEKLEWVKMVEENARLILKQDEEREAPKRLPKAPARQLESGLKELAEVLGLPGPPRRIEGFDISHVQGSHTVASMVVMIQGKARNSEYRHFRVKTVEGVDDFASMEEVVGRRYRRQLEEKKPLPDLVMIDGGKGQLAAAKKALDSLGLSSLPALGLAKRLEEFFLPGQAKSIQLPERSAGRLLIQRLRDEAHRFALKYHRLLRSKALRSSRLDEVDGVGPALKRRLLRAFGSVEGIRQVDEQALLGVEGVGPRLARKLKEALQ